MKGELDKIANYQSEVQELCSRMKTNYLELEDIVSEIEKLEESTTYDGERLNFVNERLDSIYRLEQKHKVQSITELIEIKQQLEKPIEWNRQLRGSYKSQNGGKRKPIWGDESIGKRAFLHNEKKSGDSLKNQIETRLYNLGMPYAQIIIAFSEEGEFTPLGKDKIDFSIYC